MTIKKTYRFGDTVWIYGIDQTNKKPVQGTVVHQFTLDGNNEVQYVIEIPTQIDSLLEVRTWQQISQDKNGPVGVLREALTGEPATIKFLNKTGVFIEPEEETSELEDFIHPDKIHAALEQSQQQSVHQPLDLKPKKRYYKRKPKA